MKRLWSSMRLFSCFTVTLISWLNKFAKNHMRRHAKEYQPLLAEMGPTVFKRPVFTHRNGKATGWKKAGNTSRDNRKARESILKEYLAKNVSFHMSVYRNREVKVKTLPNHA